MQKPEIRALWVTRWEYRSPGDIARIMQNAAAANFNTVLFQVRGNGTTFYQSDIEPRAEELAALPTDWDPLAIALKEAHANGLQLHVWINVGPGWRGKHAASDFDQLWNRHPEWFARDRRGNYQRLNSHYIWLAITRPEVRTHLASVVSEIVRNYHPDGVHFDYIRFPGPGFSYDPGTLARFFHLTGGAPERFPEAFDDFRRGAITAFLQQVRDSLNTADAPILSAAVWRNHDLGRNVFLQDAHSWLRRGLVDYLIPMLYTPDPGLFKAELSRYVRDVPAARVVAGMNPARDPKALGEILIARQQKCAGVSVFSYSGLFPEHRANAAARALRRDFFQRPASPPALSRELPQAVVEWVRVWPQVVVQRRPFSIAARIAGRVAANNEVVVEWKNPIDTRRLAPFPGVPGLYISAEPLVLADFEQWLEFRVVVHDSATEPPLAMSDWQHVPVAAEPLPIAGAAELAPQMGGAQFIAADRFGNLWIPAWWDNKIYVVSPDGVPLPFSPLTSGLDADGRAVPVRRPAGITAVHGDTVVVAGNGQKPLLMRFLAENGLPIAGIELPFQPYDVAASNLGELFVSEAGSGNWVHFYANEIKERLLAVPGGHLLRGIAVSPDGLTVYAACQQEGTVHQWQRFNALAAFSQVPDLDVEGLSIGCVDTDGQGNVYVSHTGLGMVTVFDREGVLRYVLQPQRPKLRGPRGVAVTPQGIFITQTGGTTPMPLIRIVPMRAKTD